MSEAVGYVHTEDPDCPCGPSIVYVHNEATDHDATEAGPDIGQCSAEEEYIQGSIAYCTLHRGHRGPHYRPAIQGREVGDA